MGQAVVCRKRKLDHERRPMPHLTADANSTTVRLDDFRDDCLPQIRPTTLSTRGYDAQRG